MYHQSWHIPAPSYRSFSQYLLRISIIDQIKRWIFSATAILWWGMVQYSPQYPSSAPYWTLSIFLSTPKSFLQHILIRESSVLMASSICWSWNWMAISTSYPRMSTALLWQGTPPSSSSTSALTGIASGTTFCCQTVTTFRCCVFVVITKKVSTIEFITYDKIHVNSRGMSVSVDLQMVWLSAKSLLFVDSMWPHRKLRQVSCPSPSFGKFKSS